jgi:hypothetical protein
MVCVGYLLHCIDIFSFSVIAYIYTIGKAVHIWIVLDISYFSYALFASG